MNGTELFKWATPKPIKTKQPIHKTMQKEPKLYKDYLPKKENVEDVRKWLRAKAMQWEGEMTLWIKPLLRGGDIVWYNYKVN